MAVQCPERSPYYGSVADGQDACPVSQLPLIMNACVQFHCGGRPWNLVCVVQWNSNGNNGMSAQSSRLELTLNQVHSERDDDKERKEGRKEERKK